MNPRAAGAPARTVAELAGAARDRFGDQVAVVDGSTRLSFAELADAVHGAARSFMSAGIGRGDRVALWAPNSARWIVAGLGAVSAGAALVPLNTRYRGDEVRYVLERSGARALVCAHGFLGADHIGMLEGAGFDLAGLAATVVTGEDIPTGTLGWDAFEGIAAATPPEALDERVASVGPDDPSDVMFTSGTTGRPKGAVLTHHQTLRVFSDWCDIVGLETGDRYLVVNPFFHCFGYKAGVVASLVRGATLYPFPLFDADAVMRCVDRERITALPGPPSLFQSILDHPDRRRFDLTSLRLAVTGAAIVPIEMIRRMQTELAFQTVLTGYGLTETNGTATMCRVGDPIETVSVSCGRAIPDVEVRVVGPAGEVLAPGEAGEVQIRGYHVMTGYLDDPAATAEAIDAEGWIRSGDIGVLDERGYLRITDRLKDMFIVGGFNAYPAEIEQWMLQHPAIAQAAVIGVADDRLGEVGRAYVVARPGQVIDVDALAAWCRDKMANFKVPRSFEVVGALPLNASGKIDKLELRARARAGR